jgi:enoyl-CoA hydratase/carnithine racemase
MASDLRLGTERSRVAFLFVRVGLAGCDMGACTMLPRIVGLGRASELLYTGRALPGKEAHDWGFYNELCSADALAERALDLARTIAQGPSVAHAMTKQMLRDEWVLPLDEAIDAEARAQAACMETNDFRRAYEAFVAKQPPQFEGN